MYSLEEGRLSVNIAREVIENEVREQETRGFDVPQRFRERSGVFVTINTYPTLELRGCIGYPQPYFPLIDALIKAAKSVIMDPRFPRLGIEELDNIVVEVSLLTPPELINVRRPKEYLKKIVIGKDGLIVAKGSLRGLLLPQVPIEWNWKVNEFLEQTCMKAGLMPDAWLQKGTRIYKFSAEIFMETRPSGEVTRKPLETKG